MADDLQERARHKIVESVMQYFEAEGDAEFAENLDKDLAALLAAALKPAESVNPADFIRIVQKHRRQVENSPGVGASEQGYALGVCDDILADLEAPTGSGEEQEQ